MGYSYRTLERESLIYEVLAAATAGLAGSNLQENQATPGFARCLGGGEVCKERATRFLASMNSFII